MPSSHHHLLPTHASHRDDMTNTRLPTADTPMKTGEGSKPKAGYKSFKKKYRKMRIVFEQKMHDGEDIFRQEAKAAATVKRLAVENDRLLDILLEINSSSAIPFEKRFDLSVPPEGFPAESKLPPPAALPIDAEWKERRAAKEEREAGMGAPTAKKEYYDLLREVTHLPAEDALLRIPELAKDLQKSNTETYPAHFLSPDDLDNYLHLIDTKLDPDTHIPTLAPLAHPTAHPEPHPLLKNPNSATSWLRRHAPQIFLQGSAGGHDAGDDDDKEAKKASKAAAKAKRVSKVKADWDATDDDRERTPVTKGKRKRIADDDGGYRPKGSGTRPNKKKRKSEGEVRGKKKDAVEES